MDSAARGIQQGLRRNRAVLPRVWYLIRYNTPRLQSRYATERYSRGVARR